MTSQNLAGGIMQELKKHVPCLEKLAIELLNQMSEPTLEIQSYTLSKINTQIVSCVTGNQKNKSVGECILKFPSQLLYECVQFVKKKNVYACYCC